MSLMNTELTGSHHSAVENQGVPLLTQNSTHINHAQATALAYQSTSPISQGNQAPLVYQISPGTSRNAEPTIASYQMSQTSMNRGADGTSITYQVNNSSVNLKPDSVNLQYQVNRGAAQSNRDTDGINLQYQVSHSPVSIGYKTSRSPIKVKYESGGSPLPYQINRSGGSTTVGTQATHIPTQLSLLPTQINNNHADSPSSSYGSGRKLSYPSEVDEQLLLWTKTQQHRGIIVSSESLRKQALAMIQPYCPDFKASTGWLDKFVARHKLDLQSNTRPTFPEVLSNGHSAPRQVTQIVDMRSDINNQRPSPTISEMRMENTRPSPNMIDVRIGDLKKEITDSGGKEKGFYPLTTVPSSEIPTVIPFDQNQVLSMENPQVIPLDPSTGIPMQTVKSGNDVVNIVLLPSNSAQNDAREDDDDDDDDDDNDNDGQLESGMKMDGTLMTPVNPERLKAFNMFVRLFIDENLDRLVPISKQPKDKISAIIQSCQRQFPEFADRARKRIRTYLKSCRRTNRLREPNKRQAEPALMTHHIPTAQLTEVNNILAQACQNESHEAAKRQRLEGLELVRSSNAGSSYGSSPSEQKRIQPVAQQASVQSGLSRDHHSSSSSTVSYRSDQQIKSNQLHVQPQQTQNVSNIHQQALTAAHTHKHIHLAPSSARHPFLTSLKSPPVKLAHAEIAAVKQLINGYRESASFLHRSADELEKLLAQSEKYYNRQVPVTSNISVSSNVSSAQVSSERRSSPASDNHLVANEKFQTQASSLSVSRPIYQTVSLQQSSDSPTTPFVQVGKAEGS